MTDVADKYISECGRAASYDRASAITLPGWVEDDDLPADLTTLDDFKHNAPDVVIEIEPNEVLKMQRVDKGGHWKTFASIVGLTGIDRYDLVKAKGCAAIRFVPVDGCRFNITWDARPTKERIREGSTVPP